MNDQHNFTPFKLERYFAQYEFSTKYLLSSSDCQSLSIEELLRWDPQAQEGMKKVWLGYTESLGDSDLRALIAQTYDGVDAGGVIVHSGAQEAIFNFIFSVLKSNDHIIVLRPAYQSLYSLAKDRNIECSDWNLIENEQNWSLDLAELKKLIKKNTRALIVNFPHNPTGFLPSREDFDEIISFCQHHRIILFSDEVYRGLEFSTDDRLPAACSLYDKAISLGVLSKTYGLPGLRIGWVASKNREILDKMASFKDFLTICNSAPSEFLAKIALKHREKLAERNLKIIKSNMALAKSFFDKRQDRFKWIPAQAGAISLVRLLPGKLDEGAENFCQKAREKQEVLLLPSTLYDHGDQHFRMGFGRSNFPEALERLSLLC